MGVEIGDSVAVDGRAGEVVDFLDGRLVVRPFPIAEQADWRGRPEAYIAQGEAKILKKHWERETSVDREHAELEARARQRSEAIRMAHYERATDADRVWHRDRNR